MRNTTSAARRQLLFPGRRIAILSSITFGHGSFDNNNGTGTGDRRHLRSRESAYAFATPEQLFADFLHDIEWWSHENRDA